MQYVAKRWLFCCASLICMFAGASFSTRLLAQELDNPGPYGFWSQDTMTGDWGGARSKLKEDGIDIHGYYIGQVGDDLHGGLKEGSSYAQQVSLQVDADLQKLFNWDDATFRININSRRGTGFSVRHSGAKLEQNWAFGAGEIVRLQWAALSQDLFDHRLNLLIGYYSMGSEFGYASIQAPFLDNGLNGHPQILPTDGSGGWNDYPIAGWGERIKYYFLPDLYVKTGLYEVNADLNSGMYGFQRNLSNATGVIIPTEITKETAFGGDKKTGLVGHYTVGGYYETGHVKDILDPSIERDGRNAEYVMVDQMVYRSQAQPKQWIALFAQAVTADRQVLPVSSYIDAGIIFHGPFKSRPDDIINFGWVKENINPRSIDVKAAAMHLPTSFFEYAEQDWELNYVFQVAPWLQVTPALQYVVDPGAYSFKQYPNAKVASLQVQVVF
jgi:porin